jgi:hypothetical protein
MIPEDEGIKVLQTVGNYSPSNATLYPRRPKSLNHDHENLI